MNHTGACNCPENAYLERCVDRDGIGQCLGAVEVEARENPSGLAAANSPAASRSRIYVSSCDCCTESSQPVAIGRGPYTSTHGTKRTSQHDQPMSAFGGKADIGACPQNVCFQSGHSRTM